MEDNNDQIIPWYKLSTYYSVSAVITESTRNKMYRKHIGIIQSNRIEVVRETLKKKHRHNTWWYEQINDIWKENIVKNI